MQDVLTKFDSLNVWKRGGQRAPHKPLLVLYALGCWQRGERQISFESCAAELTHLLREFGPERKQYHPEFPFFHLQSDNVWKMETTGKPLTRKGSNNFTRAELLRQNATGGFSPEVLKSLDADQALTGEIATRILDAHFPETLHSDILAAVGLDRETFVSTRRPRDPKFRELVLIAYEYRCAVCGFDVRLGSQSIALEAAHIKWHQAGGPDDEANGLALCVLHHKVFDLGAFTVSPRLQVLVSEKANGSDGLQETLLRFHGASLREPQRPDAVPNVQYLKWHEREVFRGRPRYAQ